MNRKDFRETMLEKNIVVIDGRVDGDMVSYIRDCIGDLICRKSPDIYLVIFSGGGNVTAGLDIYDLLSLYSGKKTGLVLNYARSMAAVILQACEYRMATKHARIMIHHISSSDVSLDVLRNSDKLSKLVDGMERDQKYLYQILSERSGKEVSVILEECAKDRDMNTDEAKAFGLIDEIWTKHFPSDLVIKKD